MRLNFELLYLDFQFAIFFSFFRGRGRNRAPTPTFRQASIPTVVPKPLKVIQNVSPQVIPNSTEFTKSASVVIFVCLGDLNRNVIMDVSRKI